MSYDIFFLFFFNLVVDKVAIITYISIN